MSRKKCFMMKQFLIINYQALLYLVLSEVKMFLKLHFVCFFCIFYSILSYLKP